MKRILRQLALCTIVGLCFLAHSPITAQLGETKQANRDELLAEFRTLFTTSPIETEKVVDAVLFDYLHLDPRDVGNRSGALSKDGTTANGLPVAYLVSQYPDGFRQVYVCVGPTNILSFEDFRGRLIKATFLWISNENGKTHSVKLFYDSGARTQAQNEWKHYRQRLSSEFPDLPALRLPDKYRDEFTGLYEGLDGNDFGGPCGVGGIAPDSRRSMVRLLDANKLTAFRYVLRSKNVVSQLYAAESLLLLEQNGRKLADTDKERIDRLRQRPDKISVCVGGEYEDLSAQKAFSYFTKETLEDYLRDWRKLGYLR